jgi:hypothetical protein
MIRHGRNLMRKLGSSNCRGMAGFSLVGPRSLNEIAHVDALQLESKERIEIIWQEYHTDESKNAIGSTLPPSNFVSLTERAKDCPMFVFPVFSTRESYYMMLSQYQSDYSVFFLTYLEDFRKDPASAQPYLSLKFFDDLMDSKELCLARTDHLAQISRHEADTLSRIMINSYIEDALYQQIKCFNKTPDDFDLEKFLNMAFEMKGEPGKP